MKAVLDIGAEQADQVDQVRLDQAMMTASEWVHNG